MENEECISEEYVGNFCAKLAIRMVADENHRGVLVAKGMLRYCDCEYFNDSNSKKEDESKFRECPDCARGSMYVIVHLERGTLLFHCLNEEIGVSEDLSVGDSCVLNIKNNSRVEWERMGTRGPAPKE